MSIKFTSLEVGPLGVNCYILWDTDTLSAAIIDPGDDIDSIINTTKSLNLNLEWILLTHGHFDHVFRVGEITANHNLKIGMQALDIIAIAQSMQLATMFYDVDEFVPFTPSDLLNDGDVIELGASEIGVIHTPGHSQGGLCFVTDAGVFCGDTIFAGFVGRTDLPGGSHDQLIHSIKSTILSMSDSTPLYPGHGDDTTVGAERKSNGYLQ